MRSLRERILKVGEKKPRKFKAGYVLRDFYRMDARNCKALGIGEEEYGSIIRAINSAIVDAICRGASIKLPYKMGVLEIRKYNTSVRIEDGKVKTTKPIDWHETLKLWSSDEEAYAARQLVRGDFRQMYVPYYNKRKADYINKAFYKIKFSKNIHRRITNMVKNGEIDALYFNI